MLLFSTELTWGYFFSADSNTQLTLRNCNRYKYFMIPMIFKHQHTYQQCTITLASWAWATRMKRVESVKDRVHSMSFTYHTLMSFPLNDLNNLQMWVAKCYQREREERFNRHRSSGRGLCYTHDRTLKRFIKYFFILSEKLTHKRISNDLNVGRMWRQAEHNGTFLLCFLLFSPSTETEPNFPQSWWLNGWRERKRGR